MSNINRRRNTRKYTNYMNTRRVGITKPIWSAVDIDNQEDFELAKFLFNKKKIRKNK